MNKTIAIFHCKRPTNPKENKFQKKNKRNPKQKEKRKNTTNAAEVVRRRRKVYEPNACYSPDTAPKPTPTCTLKIMTPKPSPVQRKSANKYQNTRATPPTLWVWMKAEGALIHQKNRYRLS